MNYPIHRAAFHMTRAFTGRWLLVAGLVLASLGAWAQDTDPPGRVARLNLLQGNVGQLPLDESDWTTAEINRPLTSGDRLRTESGARVELHSGSSAVRLDGPSALEVSQIDDNTTRLTLGEGTLNLRVRGLYPGEQMEIDTPNLAFTVQQPGSYRVEVNPRSGTTRVAARYGAGTVYGENAESLPLTANGQQLTFSGRNLAQAAPPYALQNDAFDLWADGRDRAEDQSVSARYVSRDVPGYQQLDAFGDWQNDITYGAVWLPRVNDTQWAPYRYGQWRWIAPWGWTWVDDAPWGFAPFHYGRWAQIGPRWAWVPGPKAPRPVYAPALVGFLGSQPGRPGWTVQAGPDRRPDPGIGWFPLAPGEAWRPGYRASPSYMGGINRDNGRPPRNDDRGGYHFQGRPGAVTAMPQADFGRGPAWRPNRPPLQTGDLAGAQLLPAPPMPSGRPGFNGQRADQNRPTPNPPPQALENRPGYSHNDGIDRPMWNGPARNQAEQDQRAQIQAEQARQRQREALERPSRERQAQQDDLLRREQQAQQDRMRRDVAEREQLQRRQQQQIQIQQQQQQQSRDMQNQIDPPRVRPQFQPQQARQEQQADQLRREQQGQQERLQRDVAQREQMQRQQQQQQQQQQQAQQVQQQRQQAQQAEQAQRQMQQAQQAQQQAAQQAQRNPAAMPQNAGREAPPGRPPFLTRQEREQRQATP